MVALDCVGASRRVLHWDQFTHKLKISLLPTMTTIPQTTPHLDNFPPGPLPTGNTLIRTNTCKVGNCPCGEGGGGVWIWARTLKGTPHHRLLQCFLISSQFDMYLPTPDSTTAKLLQHLDDIASILCVGQTKSTPHHI